MDIYDIKMPSILTPIYIYIRERERGVKPANNLWVLVLLVLGWDYWLKQWVIWVQVWLLLGLSALDYSSLPFWGIACCFVLGKYSLTLSYVDTCGTAVFQLKLVSAIREITRWIKRTVDMVCSNLLINKILLFIYMWGSFLFFMPCAN